MCTPFDVDCFQVTKGLNIRRGSLRGIMQETDWNSVCDSAFGLAWQGPDVAMDLISQTPRRAVDFFGKEEGPLRRLTSDSRRIYQPTDL